MAKTKQNLNYRIQMLAGKEAKTFFELFFKNLPSLVDFLKCQEQINKPGTSNVMYEPKQIKWKKLEKNWMFFGIANFESAFVFTPLLFLML